MAFQVTPMGKSQWAKIAVADTKFVADGEYSIRLRLKGENATKLQANIDKAIEQEQLDARCHSDEFLPYGTAYLDDGSYNKTEAEDSN